MPQTPFEVIDTTLPEGLAKVGSNGKTQVILMPDLVSEGVQMGRRRANKPSTDIENPRYMVEWGILKFPDGLRIYIDNDHNVIVTRQEMYP